MRSLLLTFACLCVVCAGCTRVDPQHALIAAEDGPAFAAWQRKVVSAFSPALRQEFADAVQEIRFHLGAQTGTTGRDAVEAAVCQRIDGHTVTEVLLLGDGLTQYRLAADRVQLQQALMNLMLNAVEAMENGGGELTIKSELALSGQLQISVRDTGVGLPVDNVDNIFNAFFTTKARGTGLGLAITRSVIQSHGGRIWATANPGAGATFQFTLPIREATSR